MSAHLGVRPLFSLGFCRHTAVWVWFTRSVSVTCSRLPHSRTNLHSKFPGGPSPLGQGPLPAVPRYPLSSLAFLHPAHVPAPGARAEARYPSGRSTLLAPWRLLRSYQLLFEAAQIAVHFPALLPHAPICWAPLPQSPGVGTAVPLKPHALPGGLSSAPLAVRSRASAPRPGLRKLSWLLAARCPCWGRRKKWDSL